MLSRVLVICLTVATALSAATPGCTHPIFCNETILAAIANSTYFPDSKTFVDSILTVEINQALNIFNTRPLSEFVSKCLTSNNSILKPVSL